ncbi:hypothetical protein MAX89_27210 [Escherichia coli]
MPGQYQMEIKVNSQDISPSAFQIAFLEPPFWKVRISRSFLPKLTR